MKLTSYGDEIASKGDYSPSLIQTIRLIELKFLVWTMAGVGALAIALIFSPPSYKNLISGLIILVYFTRTFLGMFLPNSSLFMTIHDKGKGDEVAITFDDGPHPEFTPKILAILKEHDIKATFFVIGKNVRRYPDILKEIEKDGHMVGTHTESHSWWNLFKNYKDLKWEIEKARDAVEDVLGYRPMYFRPPLGFKLPTMGVIVHELGLTVIGFTSRGWDTMESPPEKILANLKQGIGPGAIIALHDGVEPGLKGSREATVSLLPELIKWLKDSGYKIKRVDKILVCSIR